MEVTLGFIMIFAIGSLSLIGLFMISIRETTLDKILFILVAFATGTILASALFDLIPESLHHLEELNAEGAAISESVLFILIIVGFVAFFIIERFIYWFHGHAHEKDDKLVCYVGVDEGGGMAMDRVGNIKNFALLNLIGDGLHNFLDGIIIMVAFLSGTRNGVIVTLAVLFHEFPQEIGDFGILIYGGFSKKKALFFNFCSGMIALLGGFMAFVLSDVLEVFNFFFLAFSGGGFLYIASTELMPEILKQDDLKKSIIQALIFLCGLILIISLVLLIPHD
ncbi:MAG: ZIP family metal transporter [Candidatus Lokiarchaeota archaeon]|nr:ZIP family metal transporter [Candidatus Lokiarchaeota archaeon]